MTSISLINYNAEEKHRTMGFFIMSTAVFAVVSISGIITILAVVLSEAQMLAMLDLTCKDKC